MSAKHTQGLLGLGPPDCDALLARTVACAGSDRSSLKLRSMGFVRQESSRRARDPSDALARCRFASRAPKHCANGLRRPYPVFPACYSDSLLWVEKQVHTWHDPGVLALAGTWVRDVVGQHVFVGVLRGVAEQSGSDSSYRRVLTVHQASPNACRGGPRAEQRTPRSPSAPWGFRSDLAARLLDLWVSVSGHGVPARRKRSGTLRPKLRRTRCGRERSVCFCARRRGPSQPRAVARFLPALPW